MAVIGQPFCMCRFKKGGRIALMFGYRDQYVDVVFSNKTIQCFVKIIAGNNCLLYTSDAADELLCVDLGGRRIIKKKNMD